MRWIQAQLDPVDRRTVRPAGRLLLLSRPRRGCRRSRRDPQGRRPPPLSARPSGPRRHRREADATGGDARRLSAGQPVGLHVRAATDDARLLRRLPTAGRPGQPHTLGTVRRALIGRARSPKLALALRKSTGEQRNRRAARLPTGPVAHGHHVDPVDVSTRLRVQPQSCGGPTLPSMCGGSRQCRCQHLDGPRAGGHVLLVTRPVVSAVGLSALWPRLLPTMKSTKPRGTPQLRLRAAARFGMRPVCGGHGRRTTVT
jgi:hypothetical protein